MGARSNEAFKYNLKQSQSKEQQFATTLTNIGYTTTTTQDMGSFKGYDVTATIPNTTGTTIRYEVKYDSMSSVTNRIAVEIDKRVNGERVFSGLSATEAEWYVYTFPNDENFYLIQTDILKNMVRNKEYDRMVWGGNGNHFRNALFKKDFFLTRCMVLKNLPGTT